MTETQKRRMKLLFEEFLEACESGILEKYIPISKPDTSGYNCLNFSAEINGFSAHVDFCGSGLVFTYKGQCYA